MQIIVGLKFRIFVLFFVRSILEYTFGHHKIWSTDMLKIIIKKTLKHKDQQEGLLCCKTLSICGKVWE